MYYQLRETTATNPEVARATEAVLEAEKAATELGFVDSETADTVRAEFEAIGVAGTLDERTTADVMAAATDAATLIDRVEVRGGDTLVSFSQLPQKLQDILEEYLGQDGLQERITKHFGPFVSGDVQRSVNDIVNLIERVVVDDQTYMEGYDRRHA